MTVRELVEKLNYMPPDLPVYFVEHDCNSEVDEVSDGNIRHLANNCDGTQRIEGFTRAVILRERDW